MAKFVEIGTADIPGQGSRLRLLQRNEEFSIKIAGMTGELMNTRLHGSEDALGELPCQRIGGRKGARVLVGGLGMGFTLRAALDALAGDAEAVVSELVPGVVEWNRGPLGEASDYPLNDPRTRVIEGDVGRVLARESEGFDAIMLDVDNGPEGLTRKENNWLYSDEGLAIAQKALRPEGVLAVWSAGQDRDFSERLRRAGFQVEECIVRAHRGKGARHCIWLAW